MVKSDAAAVSNRNIVPSSHPCICIRARRSIRRQLPKRAVATTKLHTDDWNAKGKDSTPPPQIVDTRLNTAQNWQRHTLLTMAFAQCIAMLAHASAPDVLMVPARDAAEKAGVNNSSLSAIVLLCSAGAAAPLTCETRCKRAAKILSAFRQAQGWLKFFACSLFDLNYWPGGRTLEIVGRGESM